MFGFTGRNDFAGDWWVWDPNRLFAFTVWCYVAALASGLSERGRLKRVTAGLTRKLIDEGSGRTQAIRSIKHSAVSVTICWAGRLAPFRYSRETHTTKTHICPGREQL